MISRTNHIISCIKGIKDQPHVPCINSFKDQPHNFLYQRLRGPTTQYPVSTASRTNHTISRFNNFKDQPHNFPFQRFQEPTTQYPVSTASRTNHTTSRFNNFRDQPYNILYEGFQGPTIQYPVLRVLRTNHTFPISTISRTNHTISCINSFKDQPHNFPFQRFQGPTTQYPVSTISKTNHTISCINGFVNQPHNFLYQRLPICSPALTLSAFPHNNIGAPPSSPLLPLIIRSLSWVTGSAPDASILHPTCSLLLISRHASLRGHTRERTFLGLARICVYIYIYIYILYTVYIQYSWQGNYQIYGVYIRRVYTVLANPTHFLNKYISILHCNYGVLLFSRPASLCRRIRVHSFSETDTSCCCSPGQRSCADTSGCAHSAKLRHLLLLSRPAFLCRRIRVRSFGKTDNSPCCSPGQRFCADTHQGALIRQN